MALLVLFAALCFWVGGLSPTNDRPWAVEQSRVVRVRRDGPRVTLDDVRHFTWRSTSDYDALWESRTIDLDRIRGLDVIVSDWGFRALVHTIVSWDVEGEPPLAISIESRREAGEIFEPIHGLLNQYEIQYVVADEQDLVTLRASHRHETVSLYRTSTTPEVARQLLESYLAEMHRLETEPAFYNSATGNCSTTTRRHLASIGVEDTWDWRVLFNGHVDELLYERGLLASSVPIETLRARSDITQAAIEAEGAPDFSTRIRAGLPVP